MLYNIILFIRYVIYQGSLIIFYILLGIKPNMIGEIVIGFYKCNLIHSLYRYFIHFEKSIIFKIIYILKYLYFNAHRIWKKSVSIMYMVPTHVGTSYNPLIISYIPEYYSMYFKRANKSAQNIILYSNTSRR